jgi:hypothetical protein
MRTETMTASTGDVLCVCCAPTRELACLLVSMTTITLTSRSRDHVIRLKNEKSAAAADFFDLRNVRRVTALLSCSLNHRDGILNIFRSSN